MNNKEVLQVIYGGAVADAIGNPLEFKSIVTDADFKKACKAPELRISDDTQMSLFVYEALQDNNPPVGAILRWYSTQADAIPRRVKAPKALLSFVELYASEAPGGTCMTSCRKLRTNIPVVNDSKGNGTVMRAAAFAVDGYINGLTDPSVYLKAKEDALVTHKHPYAWQSSVFLCAVLLRMFRGVDLMHACYEAASALPSCEEVATLVLTMFQRTAYNDLRSRRCGWVAEEALALAIGSVAHSTDYLGAVKMACQGVSSDSDTVAGIAGQIAVAAGRVIPDGYIERLNATAPIAFITGRYLT